MAICTEGHESTATDYCDVCGAPMPVQPEPSTPAAAGPTSDAAAKSCPVCHGANPADALFCEACGYDFTTGSLPRMSALRPQVSPDAVPVVPPSGPVVQANPLDLDAPAPVVPKVSGLDLDAPAPPNQAPVSSERVEVRPASAGPAEMAAEPVEAGGDVPAAEVAEVGEPVEAAVPVDAETDDDIVDADVIDETPPSPVTPVAVPSLAHAVPAGSPAVTEAEPVNDLPDAPLVDHAAVTPSESVAEASDGAASQSVAAARPPAPPVAEALDASQGDAPVTPLPVAAHAAVTPAEPVAAAVDGAASQPAAAPAWAPVAPADAAPVPTPTAPPQAASPIPSPTAAPAPAASDVVSDKADWVAEVWIDPDWYAGQDSPDQLPSPGLPRVVGLRKRTLLIGRPSRSRGITPDVDCEPDTGVSRRHAELTTDGTRWWVDDVGSSNGTYVGQAGAPLPLDPIKGRTELGEDARVYVGSWTRVVVRRANPDEVDL